MVRAGRRREWTVLKVEWVFQQHLTTQIFQPQPYSTHPSNAGPRGIILLIAGRRLQGPFQEDSSGLLSPATARCAFVCIDPQVYVPIETLYSMGLLKNHNAFQNFPSHNKRPVLNGVYCLTYSVGNNGKFIKSATFSHS